MNISESRGGGGGSPRGIHISESGGLMRGLIITRWNAL